jgi:predicted SprT family Zn-dependent metalloprotease
MLKSAMKSNIYSLAFRNKYDIMASETAKEVFLEIIRNNYFFYKPFPKYDMEIFVDIEKVDEEYIDGNKNDNSKKFSIDANTYPDFNEYGKSTWSEISLKIKLSRLFIHKDYESFHYAIYEVIRHELEHRETFIEIGTSDKNYQELIHKVFNVPRNEMYKNCGIMAQYITHPQELPSYARSLYYLAKKEHRDYKVVIEDFLNRVFFNNDPENIKIGKEDKGIFDIVNSVRDKITERIKYFFPNARISMRALPYFG